MSECWGEGELRAYLDRELPESEQEQVAAHLKTCAECSLRYLEVAERAARVGGLVALLPEPAVRRPARVWTGGKTAAIAGLALAAALAAGFVVLPKARTPGTAVVVTPAPSPTPAPVEQPGPVVVTPAIVRHPPGHRPAAKSPILRADYYVPLDDEPIETGVVVQVGLENSDVRAELIVGPDGRARAIRILNGKQER